MPPLSLTASQALAKAMLKVRAPSFHKNEILQLSGSLLTKVSPIQDPDLILTVEKIYQKLQTEGESKLREHLTIIRKEILAEKPFALAHAQAEASFATYSTEEKKKIEGIFTQILKKCGIGKKKSP
jgi:hypothetical protein